MAQTLKFGNGTWATKKGSTLAFNDEDGNYKPLPFTTTRATGATRVNKEGLIEVVGNDKPRIDYTDSAKGALLLEPQSTNLVTYSESFDNSYWTKDGASVTSGFISPDGTANAFKIIENSSNSVHRVGRATFSAGVNRTLSFFAKKGERNYVSLFENNVGSPTVKGVIFDLENGTFYNNNASFYFNVKIENYGNGWYRCSAYFQNGGLSVPSIGVSADGLTNSYQGDGTSGIYIYGAQLEVGSYATSYIPTQGSAVTRVADTASGSGNSEVFNDSEGVLFADINYKNIQSFWQGIALTNNNSADNRIFIGTAPNTKTLEIYLKSGGNLLWQPDFELSEINQFQKIALKYKSNDLALFVNGFEVATNNSATTMPIGLSLLGFFGYGTSEPQYGCTKELGYYNTVLTDAELETLTSYRSLSELVTELNLNTL